MTVTVAPAVLGGCVDAIPSKSFAHRLLICAALSERETQIACHGDSSDIDATRRCLNALGSDITFEDGTLSVAPLAERKPSSVLDCGESGSTYRFLVPVVAALGRDTEFILHGRLSARPMSPLWDALEQHGVSVAGHGSERVRISGQLHGGTFTIPGNISSQFISGLILALPLLAEDSTIQISGKLESESYLKITLAAVNAFGIRTSFLGNTITIPGGQRYVSPQHIAVEGDWSNAAVWLCAAAACGTTITCNGLNPASVQGDRAVCDLLTAFGADLTVTENSVTVRPAYLSGTEIDASDIPDLVPVLAVLACAACGTTTIYNAGRLRLKESDRLLTVSGTLRRLGANISETEDGLCITGHRLSGGRVDSCNDHRIVMMAAIASILADGDITITNAEAIEKSYPGFFTDFSRLGGRVRKE